MSRKLHTSVRDTKHPRLPCEARRGIKRAPSSSNTAEALEIDENAKDGGADHLEQPCNDGASVSVAMSHT